MAKRDIHDDVKKSKRKKREAKEGKNKKSKDESLRDNEFYRKIKPREKIVFQSDYFLIDGEFATILTMVHDDLADTKMMGFWGVQLIPRDLDQDVSVRRFTQASRVSESWVQSNQAKAENLMKKEEFNADSMRENMKVRQKNEALVEIANDLTSGSTYLRVAFRLLVKAPTLNKLDDTVEKINRQYKDRFDTVQFYPYTGEQKGELSNLFAHVEDKQGKNFMFTSKEFAGNYDLVTHGIEDPAGEYIGSMSGDVNNSAIIMDLDDYTPRGVVLAGDAPAVTESGHRYEGELGVDMIGAKLGMAALMNNKQVVHLVLNGAEINKIGVDLSDITANVSMDGGDINMFEIFGEKEDELSLYPAHIQKLVLMAQQIGGSDSEIQTIIDGALRDILGDFYIDKGMWVENAQKSRERLRLVGLDHTDYPKLDTFIQYIEMRYQAERNSQATDQDMTRAYNVIRQIFNTMLQDNGDLFDTYTSNVIDEVNKSARVVYDFSSLVRRGHGIMMSQFVNALGFSTGNLGAGDVVIIHGAEELTTNIELYVADQVEQLRKHGVRVVFIYHNVEKMVKSRHLNRFDDTSYTFLGGMSENMVNKYEEGLGVTLPVSLRNLLVHDNPTRYYLRRGFDNLVFNNDFQLGTLDY